MRVWFQFVLLGFLFAIAPTAFAHELQPAIADVSFSETADRYEVRIALNLEAVIADIGPEHDDSREAPTAELYDTLRELPPDELKSRFEDEASEFLSKFQVKIGC